MPIPESQAEFASPGKLEQGEGRQPQHAVPIGALGFTAGLLCPLQWAVMCLCTKFHMSEPLIFKQIISFLLISVEPHLFRILPQASGVA